VDHAREGAIEGEEKDRSIVESVPEVELRSVGMRGGGGLRVGDQE